MLKTVRNKVSAQLSRVFSGVLKSEGAAENSFSRPDTSQNERDLLSKPIVLNSNEDQQSSEVLALLLSTIFNDEHFIKTISSRLGSGVNTGSIVDAEQAIEKIVLDSINAGEPESAAMASQFFTHKAQTAANQKAYSTQGRVNPDAVFWPNPQNPDRPRSLHTELPFVQNVRIIDKQTAIVSMGSCFAMEIAYALQRDGFNYIVKESNKADDNTYWFKDWEIREYATSSAAWGIHFNTPSFLQVVEKAFGHRRPAKILWTTESKGKTVFCDPFREELEFPSIEAFEKNYELHLSAARAALTEAEVLIITLGLNEVWYFKPDGSVFSRSPWRTAPSLVEHRALTVEENVAALQRMLGILREHNPRVKLIVTLSPIPLHATFQGDYKHIVEANAHSKAVLLVAAEQFVAQNDNVFYFPSYELVTSCLPNAWDPDQRHVSAETVACVMSMFRKMYC